MRILTPSEEKTQRETFLRHNGHQKYPVFSAPIYPATMMKYSLIALSCGLSLTLIGFSASPSQAQEEEQYQKNESSTLYGNNEGWSAYEMIHRMRRGNQDPEAFRQTTDVNIDNAAANYRNQLLQYWQKQKQTSPTSDATMPEGEVTSTEVME